MTTIKNTESKKLSAKYWKEDANIWRMSYEGAQNRINKLESLLAHFTENQCFELTDGETTLTAVLVDVDKINEIKDILEKK